MHIVGGMLSECPKLMETPRYEEGNHKRHDGGSDVVNMPYRIEHEQERQIHHGGCASADDISNNLVLGEIFNHVVFLRLPVL